MGSVVKPDPKRAQAAERMPIGVHYVSAGYFSALGIPLRSGRLFDERDGPGSARVVLLGETAARRLWPGESAVGRRLAVYTAYFQGGDSTAEVIGVVGDVQYGAREAPLRPDVYAPALQMSFRFASFFVRTAGDPLAIVGAAREAVRRSDPNLPIYDVRTMEEREAIATARPRFATLLLLAFAGLGVLLAAVGVYGVMAYAVANRNRELGIRMALGADPGRLRRMVLTDAAQTATGGLVLGVAGALALTRFLGSLLYQVDPRDPGVLVPSALVLLAVALAAAYLPARHAAAIDPLRSIRSE
jgi:predicted permease